MRRGGSQGDGPHERSNGGAHSAPPNAKAAGARRAARLRSDSFRAEEEFQARGPTLTGAGAPGKPPRGCMGAAPPQPGAQQAQRDARGPRARRAERRLQAPRTGAAPCSTPRLWPARPRRPCAAQAQPGPHTWFLQARRGPQVDDLGLDEPVIRRPWWRRLSVWLRVVLPAVASVIFITVAIALLVFKNLARARVRACGRVPSWGGRPCAGAQLTAGA